MSHFTTVQTKIRDIDSLKRALVELNYSYREGHVKVRGWGGKTENADLVVEVSQNYDVGFRHNQEVYDLVADWWGIQLTSELTQNGFKQQITQQYSYQKTIKELQAKGFFVTQKTVTEENVIELTVEWSS